MLFPVAGLVLVDVRAEGLATFLLFVRLACGLVPAGAAVVPGAALAGAEALDVPGVGAVACVGLCAAGEEDPAGELSAVGEALNAPETSSAIRPPLAATAAPSASAPARRRRRGTSSPAPGGSG
ncbi:MAG TPA: hypothetical protein VHF26_05075, partial [Trebonia sp.]|nr:hypothetical protein [Trebonia sp.]